VVTGEACNAIEHYVGWDLAWVHRTQAPVHEFVSMDGTYIVSSGPISSYGWGSATMLESLDQSSGTVLWERRCTSGWQLDTSWKDDGESTPPTQQLGVMCDRFQAWLNPTTGEQVG
jgi:hypothetical protein